MRWFGKVIIGFLKVIVVLLVLFGAYIAWSVVRERQASASANAFCARFPASSAMADAAAAARDEGERMLRRIDEKEIRVGYIGMYPFSRYTCILEGQGGKVTRAGVKHRD
jgi:hypothetical protein